jgi:AraC family transcriptional activator of pobA
MRRRSAWSAGLTSLEWGSDLRVERPKSIGGFEARVPGEPRAAAADRRFADAIRVMSLSEAAAARAYPVVGEHLLILFVGSGRGGYRVGASRVDAGPGTVAVTAPGESYDARGLASGEGWLVEFEPAIVGLMTTRDGRIRPHAGHVAWLSFVRAACLARRFVLPNDLIPAWTRRGQQLLSEVEARRVGYNQALASHLTILLLDIARLVFPQLQGPSIRLEPVVAQMFDVIENGFDEPLSLDDVARRLAVSPGHLARVVRRVTGRSVNEWIAERRMVEARRLLLDGRFKVEQ